MGQLAVLRPHRGAKPHVHNSAVDVAELLEPEEAGAMSAVVEGEAGGGVDGNGTRIGCRIGGLSVLRLSIERGRVLRLDGWVCTQRATAASQTFGIAVLLSPFFCTIYCQGR